MMRLNVSLGFLYLGLEFGFELLSSQAFGLQLVLLMLKVIFHLIVEELDIII